MTSSLQKKDTYIKGKSLDPDFTAYMMDLQQGIVRVTGNEGQMMKVNKRDIDEIVSKQYISDVAVDAGLLLLDKRLNDVANPHQEKITVYSVATCRLILGGLDNIVPGKFITIIPRHMALEDLDEVQETVKTGIQPVGVNAGHFTLVSNLFCNEGECNVFETFDPYINEENLLNSEGKKLLKLLCNAGINPLIVKCINVNLQEENECGAIAFALAIQLCFYYHEGGLNTRFIDVRQHLLSCLQQNALVDFPHIQSTDDLPNETVRFSIIV